METSSHESRIVLKDWGSAIFPEGIDDLRDAYVSRSDDIAWLDIVSQQVGVFNLRDQEDDPVTSDGRVWRVGYYFVRQDDRDEIAVLFPVKDADGNYRNPAVFVRNSGQGVADDLRRFIRDYVSAIRDE